ncbi:MAG: MFS transporter, partial [Afipia sp.]|nr:MFS transporter [Afipia sp.]
MLTSATRTARHHSTATDPSSASLPLLALAAASFGIGTTEYVVMGLLPDVAVDLGVSVPKAGLLVSGYALSVAFGSPFLAVATARLDRRRALLALMAVFIVGNLACALAPTYALLMAARILTALCHGAFFGLGAVVAAAIVAPARKARAIAMMFAGLTLANVLGVPFGTAIGEAFGWRDTFLVVAAVGVSAAFALYLWLPRHLPLPPMNLRREVLSLANAQVVLAMLISVVSSAGLFSVFTYITPILETVTRVSPHDVTL